VSAKAPPLSIRRTECDLEEKEGRTGRTSRRARVRGRGEEERL
jgi:hypothetical protein